MSEPLPFRDLIVVFVLVVWPLVALWLYAEVSAFRRRRERRRRGGQLDLTLLSRARGRRP